MHEVEGMKRVDREEAIDEMRGACMGRDAASKWGCGQRRGRMAMCTGPMQQAWPCAREPCNRPGHVHGTHAKA